VDASTSDTGRLYDAGAVAVVASSPDKRTRVDRLTRETALSSMAGEFGDDVDLIVAEGFKADGVPKVLVWNDDALSRPIDNVIAVVGDGDVASGCPRYSSEQLDELVGQLRDTFL
jgi:molybdopterin-guanine dinucleotide biosynthesis protein MobB